MWNVFHEVELKSICQRAEQPRLLLAAALLVGADLLGFLQCQADLIEPIEQAVLAKGSISKPKRTPAGVMTHCPGRSISNR
jgi:hypothetical protein